jgi:negative regulator of flagellin synthesis FlgM
MKIDNSSKPVGLPSPSAAARGPGKGAQSTGAVGADADDFRLSARSAQLQALSGGSPGEVFDAAKVAEIKNAISEGRFKVNPEAVADSLLQSVRELLLASPRAPQ